MQGMGEDDDIEMEEYKRQIASVLDEDGNLIYDGPDPTCRKYCVLRKKAKKYHLQELDLLIPELVGAVHSKSPKALADSCFATQMGGLISPPSPQECLSKLAQHCDWVEKALQAFSDRKIARAWSQKDDISLWVLTTLAPKSKFDMGHAMQQINSSMTKAMQQKNNRADPWEKKFQDFKANKPIDKYLRVKESGYQTAVRFASQLTDAETANDCGKKAWKAGKKWTAELYWQRATELGSGAKYYSNLAFVRIHLGRFLRSYHLGYRDLAAEMLEQAIKDAQASVELDPTFQRAYQRWAEALLALGPYDRAMEAYRVLAKAKEATIKEDLSAPLAQLQEAAKINARRWLPVALSSSTIPKTLHTALANLRSVVVASLAIDDPLTTDEDIKQAAEKIVDAAWAVRGAIQLVYMRWSQWEREKEDCGADAVKDTVVVEMELRKIAKVIPLRVIELCDELTRLAFMEDPWTLWGLDRLDRKCVSYLQPDADDPCIVDKLELKSAEFRERIQRQTGGSSMDRGEIMSVAEIVQGKGPESFDQDMSPNTFAALSCGVLQRIILAKDCILSPAAPLRVIGLYFLKNGNGLWAGGEFLGMCMNCVSGVGKYGSPFDAAKTAELMRLPLGVAAMAREITQSQDNHEYYQKALATLSAEDWASLTSVNILYVLRDSIVAAMDETSYLEPAEIATYIETILSAMLDGVPDIIKMFRTGFVPDDFDPCSNFSAVYLVLTESAFGVFLTRRFERYEQYLKDEGQVTFTTKDVVRLLIQKWLKISKDKRSAYRWESLDDESKEELAHMAPVDKADLMTQSGETKDKKVPGRTVLKAPECAYCREKKGCGVVLLWCPCRAAQYCQNRDCQKLDRPNHKKICKQFLSGD
jgi:tetratricopeptide (TPR) repeat protein